MKRAYIIGALLVVAFGALGLSQLRNTLTTYVGFSEARTSGTTVQIKGKIDKSSVHYDEKSKDLIFNVTDGHGQRMIIQYGRSAPGNFNQASHVVAVGKFYDGRFHANDLLIKCPSKYQGQSSSGDK